MKKTDAMKQLFLRQPLMKCGHMAEFKQRLQWLSEGMLSQHLEPQQLYKPNGVEILDYRRYKAQTQSSMKVKTLSLEGRQLDAAVCLAQGWAISQHPDVPKPIWMVFDGQAEQHLESLDYHANWALVGPLLDREGIDLYCNVPSSVAKKHKGWNTSWRARYTRCGFGTDMVHHETPTGAAACCFVLARIGELVELPEGLT